MEQALTQTQVCTTDIICRSIEGVYGAPIDHRDEPATVAVVSALVADELEQEIIAHTWNLDIGESAERALADARCAQCALRGLCQVKAVLEQRAEIGAFNRELAAVTLQISTAPNWLKRARASLVDDRLREAVATGAERPSALLAGAENSRPYEVTSKEAPILDKLRGLRAGTFNAWDITTAVGKFQVIDASEATSFKGPRPPVDRQPILDCKMLQRMQMLGADGKPQILSADQSMQKRITGVVSEVGAYEIKMNGKNRQYIAVDQLPDDNEQGLAGRIVLLGSHGGNDQTQNQFIDTVIRRK